MLFTLVRTVLGLLLLLACIGAAVVWNWTITPHGRLTVPAAILSRIATWQESSANESIAAMRESRRQSMRLITGTPTAVAAVRDERIPGPGGALAVRIYHPSAQSAPLPVIVYFHGGGWVLGDLDSHDNVCRALAVKAGAVVVAVDYRLAPEHPYPAAVDDAHAAVRWVADNADSIGADAARIAVAGDSAGGNLAAAVSLLARERGPALRAQALIYPGVDMMTLDRPSLLDFAEGLFLTHARIEWFKDQYIPDRARRGEPLASPLLAADHRGLPAAIVVTAQFDPLRDEGEAYARALEGAGVPVELKRYEGVIHGFVSMDRWFPESATAIELIGASLRQHFSAGD
jgi:acetyl esterase